jgi:hypothetical protein
VTSPLYRADLGIGLPSQAPNVKVHRARASPLAEAQISVARAPVQPLVGQPPPPELAALVAGTATVARRCQRCEPATLRATWRGHGATDILFFLLRYPSLTSSFPEAVQRQGSPGPRDGQGRRGLSPLRGLRCNR